MAEKLQPYVAQASTRVVEVKRKAIRLILSEKVALYEEAPREAGRVFSSLQVGQQVKGNVRSIAPFGVFVDLGGIDGLSTERALLEQGEQPGVGLPRGEEVEAEVIDINHERGRTLSIRACSPTRGTHGGGPQGRRHHRWHRDQDR